MQLFANVGAEVVLPNSHSHEVRGGEGRGAGGGGGGGGDEMEGLGNWNDGDFWAGFESIAVSGEDRAIVACAKEAVLAAER